MKLIERTDYLKRLIRVIGTPDIKVFPFSFKEFLKYYDLPERYGAFDRYLRKGGMSGSYLYRDQEEKYHYIEDVFDTLIVRDIRQKYKIRNTVLMDRIVDFFAVKRNEKIYIQVSDDIREEKMFKREVTPLLQIRDAYPKMVIARIRDEEYQYEGIRIVDVADWLAEG